MSILSIESRESRKGSRSAVMGPSETAAGEIHVLRVVQGLGYGLDEAVEQAAMRIRFKPAQADGRAVDYRATVHITFRIS